MGEVSPFLGHRQVFSLNTFQSLELDFILWNSISLYALDGGGGNFHAKTSSKVSAT